MMEDVAHELDGLRLYPPPDVLRCGAGRSENAFLPEKYSYFDFDGPKTAIPRQTAFKKYFSRLFAQGSRRRIWPKTHEHALKLYLPHNAEMV